MLWLNEEINEEWIFDKLCYIWDGLKIQCFDWFYVKIDGKLQFVFWVQVFQIIVDKVKVFFVDKIGVFVGQVVGVEDMFVFKGLMDIFGVVNIDSCFFGLLLYLKNGWVSYLFNFMIQGIEEVDVIMLIGINLCVEVLVLNVCICKCWSQGDLIVGVIGENVDFIYLVIYFGVGLESFK